MKRFTIIGAAHLDALVEGVDEAIALHAGSCAAEQIRLGFGGDALNEAVALSRLGGEVDLIGKVGLDAGGAMVLEYCRAAGVNTEHIRQEEGLRTALNIVLIDRDGERSFITDPQSSLRALSLDDVLPHVTTMAPIVCFASIFVSPKFTPEKMKALFRAIKANDSMLCADTTKRKNNEKLADLTGFLPYIDVLFTNFEEAKLLSDKDSVEEVAQDFRRHGVNCVVIKTGGSGCYIDSPEVMTIVPACKCHTCVDTTGAGDNFAAGFLFARAHGASLLNSARFANAIASICVEHVGATLYATTLEEVLERCQANYPDFSFIPCK